MMGFWSKLFGRKKDSPLPRQSTQTKQAADTPADRGREPVRTKARCSFCDIELSPGEGGVANVNLFPGYPAGRRRQSLGCLPCLKKRGADEGQLKLATAAAELWWKGWQRGEDPYIKPDMLSQDVVKLTAAQDTPRAAGFRMRIESLADMFGCVMVAGPVQSGYVRVGARVAVVHGNERHEGRIKDSTSMGGRQAYVLDGIPGNAIQKGDILVEA